MKPLIPTFKKMSLTKKPFAQSDIKSEKLINILTEPSYISNMTKNDLILEHMGIIPIKAEYYYEESLKEQKIMRQKMILENKARNKKDPPKKYSYFNRKAKLQTISSISLTDSFQTLNLNPKIKAKFKFHSPEQFIDFYKYYLENEKPRNLSEDLIIKPKPEKAKRIIKNLTKKETLRYQKSNLFMTEPSERTRMKTTTISFPVNKSDSGKDRSFDESILHFPDELKLNSEKNSSILKQKVKLYKLKSQINQMNKEHRLKEDSDKVRESSSNNFAYIRKRFGKNLLSSYYNKNSISRCKLTSYINKEQAVRPFLYWNGEKWINKNSHLSKLKKEPKKDDFKKYIVPQPIQKIDLSEFTIPKKVKNQWMIDTNIELSNEVIDYQKQLGIFKFSNERGVFAIHSNILDQGDYSFKKASKY